MAGLTGESTFTVGETHGRALRLGNQLLMHSPDAGWRSIYAATFREVPFRAHEPAIGHPSLIYHLAHPTTVTRRIGGTRPERTLIGPRRFCLTPGNAVADWQHEGRPEILQIYLRGSVYHEAAEALCRTSTEEALIPRFAIADPMLEQLALAILTALRDGTAEDGLYVDTLAQMMAVHLVRAHAAGGRPAPPAVADRLANPRLRSVLDYIEAHLGNDLSLRRLAAQAGISPIYLPRVFKAALGQPPHRYVLARRIERAKLLLRTGDAPVVDVALAVGFSSQSHLSHWFLREVGVSPAAYRRNG